MCRPRSHARLERRRLLPTLVLLSYNVQRCFAEDVCAFFSTPASLALVEGVPQGADLEGCSAFLHDATPECQLQCNTSGSFRHIAGSGVIRCDPTNLIAGSNSEPEFEYVGTLSCEDISSGLSAQLVMNADFGSVTAGDFIAANVTVVDSTTGAVVPVLDGEVCAQLVETPSPSNQWAYLRSAEVQDISAVVFANYSQFYEDNPSDPLEVLPLSAADVELNRTLNSGSFALQFRHLKKVERTPPIAWNASAAEMQLALQALEEIHMVSVSKVVRETRHYEELGVHPYGTVVTGITSTSTWSVTFRGSLAGSDLETLTPLWRGAGCPTCDPFDLADSARVTAGEAVAGSFWPCAPFVEGVASFPTLQINEVGTHAIHYYFDRWQVDAPEFNVSVGPAATVIMLQEPGFALGGSAFALQPVLAAADLGGNQVHNVSFGAVTASLLYQYGQNEDGSFNYTVHHAPNGTLGPESETTRRFDEGVATFRNLKIDVPGLYALLFDSDLDVEWPFVVHHRQRVGVGKPSKLGIRTQPEYEEAGVPFAVQPVIELQDEAGNVVDWDSESRVLATIYNNPCAGNIGGSGSSERSLFNHDWGLVNTSGCGTLMRAEVQRLSVYLVNVEPANVTLSVSFQMGVKVTTGGQFDRFDYYGSAGTVDVPFLATAEEMRAALESLPGIGFLRVTKSNETGSAYNLADWDVTFVSDKGNIPALKLGCSGGIPCDIAFNTSVLNSSAPYVIATEVDEVVHGCLSPELCLDAEEFYVDHIAVSAENGIATFTDLSIDTAGSGYVLRFELEGSDGNVTVDSAELEIFVGEPAFLAAQPLLGSGHWANGESLSTPPAVVLWDAGFNRIAGLSGEDGHVVASIVADSNSVPLVQDFLDHGIGSVCVGGGTEPFLPAHWQAPSVSAGVCRSICTAMAACSGFMTNSSALSMLASQASSAAGTSDTCLLFANETYAAEMCTPSKFTVTTDWNRTAFAVNGMDLAALTDDYVADRPSQLYDFWRQEAGGGYAVVALSSVCTPTDIVAARAFHVVEDDPVENDMWQTSLEAFVSNDVADGNVVLVSLEWEDLANCDDWQGTGAPTAPCPGSSLALSGLLGATVTAADVAACNAACSGTPGGRGNCSYALIAVKGFSNGTDTPAMSEFLNCTRVVGCGYDILYADGGCQSGEYETFQHAEVLGDTYTVDECYQACRDIAWCEHFAAGAAGGHRQGECLVYSGKCSSKSLDTALVTYEMRPCSAEATIDVTSTWSYQAASALNSSNIAAVEAAAAASFESQIDFVHTGASSSIESPQWASYHCFERDFHDLYDVRAGQWKQPLDNGWANFSSLGFSRPGSYEVRYEFVRFVADELKGTGYRCPDNQDVILLAEFTPSATHCQGLCVDKGADCSFAVFWSGKGATGYCELCSAPFIYYRDGYYRGSAADLVPVDGADAREGRRPVSSERYVTTVYARRVYGDLQEVVSMDIRPSSEYVVSAATPLAGELVGAAVAVGEGGIVVAGAYGSSVPTYEVQYLRTTATSNTWAPEIQVLQVGVREHSHEIQTITLSPLHPVDVGGTFTVSWNGRGPSRAVPFDVSAVQLEKILEEDLTGVGDLEVTRLSDWQCEEEACLYQWRVTFVSVNETYLGCHAFSDGEGTARDGTPCAYPFKVGNKVFTSCANGREEGGRVAAGGDPDRYWCSTTYDFDADRLWGFCECPEFGTWPEMTVDGTDLVGNTSCTDVWTEEAGVICRRYTLEALNLDREACEAFALEKGRAMFSFGSAQVNTTQCLLCDPGSTELVASANFNTSNHSLSCNYDHPEIYIETTQHAAVIAGEFTLQGEGNSSVGVAWNETRDALLEKIETNLLTTDYLGNLSAIDLIDVNRGLPDAQGGYTWTITFNPSDTVYDVPQLSILGQQQDAPDECQCEGNCCNDTESTVPGLQPVGNTKASVWTLADGQAPLGEWFNVYFQGAGPTGDIPYNATAEEMEYALQQLATIDDVEVTVTTADSNNDKYGICRKGTRCYEWAVTFKRTRRATDYGYVIDEFGNLPPLEPDTSLLAGTGANIAVDYLYEGSPELGQKAIRGDDGTRAGSVYVFVPKPIAAKPEHRTANGGGGLDTSSSWTQQSRLTASDASAFDMFGFSVAVDGAVKVGYSAVDRPARIVVGAPGHPHRSHTADIAASYNQSVGAAYVFERRLGRAESDYGSANDTRHPDDDSNEFAYDWVEVQMLQPEDTPNDNFGWGFGESVAVHEDSIAVGAPQESSRAGAVYIYHVERAGNVENGGFVEIQRLTSPDIELSGYEPETDADGNNVTTSELFGSVVVIEDDILAVSAPGMYDGLGAVFLFQWVEESHPSDPQIYADRDSHNASGLYRHYSFLQRLLYPLGDVENDVTSAAAARASGFGSSVALTGDFVVIGAPTDADSVGRAFVFSRREGSSQFEFAQTLSPIDDFAGGHFGVGVAVAGRTIAISARQTSNDALLPAATVQLLAVRAGTDADGVPIELAPGASTFAVGFREQPVASSDRCYRETRMRCPPEEMNFRCYECFSSASGATQFVVESTPRLRNDASAEDVRLALEELGTGPLRVERTREPDGNGGYGWAVTFLDTGRFDGAVPVFETFSGELQGQAWGATINVETLVDSPQRDEALWSAVYTFTTAARLPHEVASGEQTFIEQGLFMPQNAQHADHYGAAVSMHRGVLAVGALNRAPSDLLPEVNAGAVFVNSLNFLEVSVDSTVHTVREDATALNIVSHRCAGECVAPHTGQGMFEDLAPVVEGQPLVYFAGQSLRCYSPAELGLPADRDPSVDSIDSTAYSPYVESVSEGVTEWTLRIEGVSAAGESLLIGVAATQSLYVANHTHTLADEASESYLLPGVGFAYDAQTGQLVNYSAPLGSGSAGFEFVKTVYGPSLRPGDLLTVRLTLDAASTGALEYIVNGVSVGVAARGLFDDSTDPATSYRLLVGLTCGGTNDNEKTSQNHVVLERLYDVPIMFATGDEVSDSEVDQLLLRRAQWYLANRDGLAQYLPYGTASGSSTCVPSLDAVACLWLEDGVYDYDGIQDYAPTNASIVHVARDYNHQETVTVMITNDDVVETPNEFLNAIWWIPGFAPSLGGQFWSQVTITDDGDGASGTVAYSNELFSEAPEEGDFAGTALATSGQWVIVGAMQANHGAGSVDVYFNSLGVWVQTQELKSPAVLAGAVVGNRSYFGASVDLDLDNMQLIVGAFGEGAAYVFSLDNDNATGMWTLEGRLTVPDAERMSANAYFGWLNAVSISGLYAAVGAKGLEAVYLFSFNETSLEWNWHQTIYSSDYYSYKAAPTTTVGGGAPRSTTYVLQQEFGCSVSMSLTTLAVGARRANYDSNRTVGSGGLSAKGAVYTFFPHDQDYIGCFEDATTRDFEVEAAARDPAMSVSKCEQLCSDYEFYALQRGTYCFCSAEYPGYPRAEATQCNSKCSNASETGLCGGIWFNSVYRNVYSTHHNQSGLIWVEHSKLLPDDGVAEDFFGAVVALDNDTLVVSSWKNPAMSHATWNFERGDTSGWLTTGDAFDNQPTFGENVLYRTVYGDPAINLSTSGVYSRFANMQPFGNQSGGFVDGPDDFESTISNATTEEECTRICDDHGDDCLGFLRTTTSSATDLGLCTLVHRSDFMPHGIRQENITTWAGGTMHLKQGAEPFFLYTKPRDRYARYFEFEGVQSNVKVRPQGNWWIGTFEDHPANGPIDEWGRSQGDSPTGTMASSPFVIGGAEISFLIGGGCDVRKIFAELVVGRQRVRVATGECTETMRRVHWNVAEWKGRTAVLRIADLATGVWGHINFDDVRFSWRVEGRSGDFEDDVSAQTASAGAAYVFRRHADGNALEPCACECAYRVPKFFKQELSMRAGESFEEHCLCTNNKWDCEWSQEVKLEASDKATQAFFGHAVAVSQEHGIIAVGAHNAQAVNQFSSVETTTSGSSSSKEVGTGAVYLYTRQEEYRDAFGNQVHYASWAQDFAHALRGYADVEEMLTDAAANPNFPASNAVSTERLRLQSTGPRAAGDMFGFSVAVAEDLLVAGAPLAGFSGYTSLTRSGGVVRSGAAYVFQTEFRTVQFSERFATVAEADPGDHSVHAIGYRLVSHVTWLSVELTRSGDVGKSLEVAYATSDITAQGVTPDEASVCLQTPYRNRTSQICGDYVHTKGTVEFLPRETLTQIVIPIMDDECAEDTEFFQLQLSTIGGDPLVGELYHMTISIDDNDFGSSTC